MKKLVHITRDIYRLSNDVLNAEDHPSELTLKTDNFYNSFSLCGKLLSRNNKLLIRFDRLMVRLGKG